jgi:major type 1 subunit fimbrin (pilin)
MVQFIIKSGEFIMKKRLLAALVPGLLYIPCANAADANINFTGRIVSSTCDATAGVSGGQNISVQLGDYTPSSFATVGSESPAKPFKIQLTDCPASGGPASATVTFTGTADSVNNSYVAVTGGATGVAINIKDASGNVPVNLESALYTLNTDATQALNFTANYISTAATPGPGDADATLTANVAYY